MPFLEVYIYIVLNYDTMHCCFLEPRTYSLLRSRKGAGRVLRLIMAPMQSSRLKSCNRYTNLFFICFIHFTYFCGREQDKKNVLVDRQKLFIIEKYFGTKSFVDICACQQRNTTEPQQITLLQQTIGVIARSPFLSLAFSLLLWASESMFFSCFSCLSDFFARSLRPFSTFCML
jgi:hypothetical protein